MCCHQTVFLLVLKKLGRNPSNNLLLVMFTADPFIRAHIACSYECVRSYRSINVTTLGTDILCRGRNNHKTKLDIAYTKESMPWIQIISKHYRLSHINLTLNLID